MLLGGVDVGVSNGAVDGVAIPDCGFAVLSSGSGGDGGFVRGVVSLSVVVVVCGTSGDFVIW